MLDLIRHDAILELRLARPPVNALDPSLTRRLREAVESAPGDGVRGLVLSGRAGLFSAGLDVPALLALDRPAMGGFWDDFIGLCGALARSPIPTVAAITGHSPAGGAVLSIFCDYRVMAAGPHRIGLNEVQVGLVVPEVIQYAVRRLVGAHRAERLMVAGAMIEADEALRIGLVDELAVIDEVVPRALAWLGNHLALPAGAMGETRRIARTDLAAKFARLAQQSATGFTDVWFGAEAQEVLGALVETLRSRKG